MRTAHCRRAYKELRAHIILATFFRGEAPICTSWFGGGGYANASWQPVKGLFPFRVAARQALRKKKYCLLYWFILSYCPTMSRIISNHIRLMPNLAESDEHNQQPRTDESATMHRIRYLRRGLGVAAMPTRRGSL